MTEHLLALPTLVDSHLGPIWLQVESAATMNEGRKRVTPMRPWHLVLALLLALLLMAAACSDDDDASSTQPEPGASSSTTEEPTVAAEATTTTTSAPDPTTTSTTIPSRGEDVAVPSITPVTGGERGGLPANPAPREILEEYDYVEEEFFISGEAEAYTPIGVLGEDGMWSVEPSGTAPYTTRILVRRPADPAEANGVIGVEWLNVSGGQDADPDFGFIYPEMLARGTTWVGVSAQFNGVDGVGLGIDIPGVQAIPLKTADPVRYEPIDHPGDDYSYDMYSQAAQAIRRPDGIDPLGGVSADLVIALGESQSAGRLTTYLNALHPMADIYDGFFVHSRGSGAAPVSTNAGQATVVKYRTDLADPIMFFQTETDVSRGFRARQADTDGLVTWEVAGTAHADQQQLDYGNASIQVIEPDFPVPDFQEMCGGTLNEGPQPLVLQRAWADLVRWVAEGTPPAAGPQLELEADGAIVRDELGIAIGGIRTPDVDVPIVVFSGDPLPDSSVICSLFGSTRPLAPDVIASLYPTHEDYVDEVRASAQAALEGGFLLQEGADAMVEEAEAAPVPG